MNRTSMDSLIVYVLRTGLWLSVIIVAIGGAFYLYENGFHLIHYQILEETPPAESVITVFRKAATLSAEGMISLGLFILVLTQVVRVALTVIIFMVEKDRIFALISTAILIILIYSIFWRS